MKRGVRIMMFIATALGSTVCLGHGGLSQWTIVASYSLPEGASGLAWDGANLYCGIYGANGGQIYIIDPETGLYDLLFDGDHEDAFGLTYDGANLWTTDHSGGSATPASAMKLDWNGNVIEAFDLPDHYMSGIAYDGGDFWVSRYYPDPGHLYKVDDAGGVIDGFDGPDNQPWDLAIGSDSLWVADYWGDTLYQLDSTTGNLIDSHASQGVDPAGIVWDGQYIWYCDNGDTFTEDVLYKVDVQGSGSPEIVIADTAHDFGVVALGDEVTWEVDIANTGTGALVIADVVFAPEAALSCAANFPVVVPAGGSTQLGISFAPMNFGVLDATATIISNDPVHPSEEVVITGHGVYADPTLDVAAANHDFGQVRSGAHTRWFIDVSNQGLQPLVIENVTSNNELFYVDPALELPIVIGTLASAQIGLWFAPAEPCFCAGQIDIASNDPDQSLTQILVVGSGLDIEYPIGTELWSSQFTDNWDNSFKAMASIPDVSGDGWSDVIGCSEDNFIRCFNGNADQTGDVLWSHEIYSGNVYSGRGLDNTDDVDGDGYADVVVGATGGARLIRMLSGKTGEALWTYHTDVVGDGGWVYQVDATRDFTGDGTVDVLAVAGDDGSGTGPKRAYLLNGLSGGLIWQRPLGGPGFAIMALDDCTGDGVPDAVVGASNESESAGRAVGLDGATGSELWSFPTSGASIWAVAPIGDVSGDGINDVMVGGFLSGQYYGLDATDGSQLYAGTGLGTLTGFQRLDDVDGDGHPDIVPEHFGNMMVVISGRTGEHVWSMPVADNPSVSARIADVSGDGVNDLVVGTLYSDNYTYFMDGVDGAILHTANFGTPVDSIMSMPDVVGDGSWELVAGGRDGTITCLSGGIDAVVYDPADVNEDGVVGVDDLLAVIGQWGSSGGPADVNGDGIVGVDDLLLVVSAWNKAP